MKVKALKTLTHEGKIVAKGKVIDLAADSAEHLVKTGAAQKVGKNGKVTVLDLSKGMLDVAKQRAIALKLDDCMEFVIGDIDNLPFEDDFFDTVLSSYSACPLGDPTAGALELLRVVKQGGFLGMAHSVSPQGPFATMFGNIIESIAWHFPSISLGCRAVEILPGLLKKGVSLVFEKRIGPPYLPFQVFVVRKGTMK